MAKLYLVRHGRAASSWGLEEDPGLDALGRAQAEAAAQRLASLGQLPIITSPLKRARETSAPLAAVWRIEPIIEPRVGEIRFPSETPADRVRWLKEVMADQWSNLSQDLQAWRLDVIETLYAIRTDSVIFSHFIAINVAVGFAVEDDRVVSFRPDNASITVLETNAININLLKRGDEADTRVN
ncbi:MAG: histidine phosphatase family protein [Desulfobacterales bacterium]|nr:MAG: histidine phosphatase family protein [Desulfobacterales bacterium]